MGEGDLMAEHPEFTRLNVPRVLLRSSWQMANIGDMAHAPGAIGLLARHAPDVEVVLWARRISDDERAVLIESYPRLRVITGELDDSGRASTPELAEELQRCTFLLHGSGRLLAGEPDVVRWRALTGKPYGFLGITVDPLSPPVPGTNGVTAPLADMLHLVQGLGSAHMPIERWSLLREAAFVYCRDSISAHYLAQHGLASATVGFGPDAVFAFDAGQHGREEAAAIRQRFGLEDDGYVCVVPRLRYTPYHSMGVVPAGRAELLKDAINATYRDREFGVLAELIIDTVRTRGRRVLICPEMSYAGPLGLEIAEQLPADVREHVGVMTDFWGPAAAMGVFAGASAVVSMECHSPILAARVGVPALYLRQPTDTIKGAMWADLGMADRIAELENCDLDRVLAIVGSFLDEPAARAADTRARAAEAQALLDRLTATAVDLIRGESPARAAVGSTA